VWGSVNVREEQIEGVWKQSAEEDIFGPKQD
jgi:hypothetical protein